MQGDGLGIARGEPQAFVERGQGCAGAAEAELQFRHARPGKAEAGRSSGRGTRSAQGPSEIGAGLMDVGGGEVLGGAGFGKGIGGGGGREIQHGGDQVAQRGGQSCGLGAGGVGESVEQGFGLIHAPDGEQHGTEEYFLGVGSGLPSGWISSQCALQITGAIGVQRSSERDGFRWGEFEIIRVEHSGIVEAPLDEAGGEEGGRLDGRLAGINDALFAAGEPESAQGVGQFRFAVEEGQDRSTAGFHGEKELGAFDAGVGDGGIEEGFLGLVAMEQIEETFEEGVGAGLAGGHRRLDQELREFPQLQITLVEQAEEGAAALAGAHDGAGTQRLVCSSGLPGGAVRRQGFNLSVFLKNRGGVVRRRRRGRGREDQATAEPGQQQEPEDGRRESHVAWASRVAVCGATRSNEREKAAWVKIIFLKQSTSAPHPPRGFNPNAEVGRERTQKTQRKTAAWELRMPTKLFPAGKTSPLLSLRCLRSVAAIPFRSSGSRAHGSRSAVSASCRAWAESGRWATSRAQAALKISRRAWPKPVSSSGSPRVSASTRPRAKMSPAMVPGPSGGK